MTTEETSKLKYITDHLMICPEYIDYLLLTSEQEKMSKEYENYLEIIWKSSSLNETIEQIKKEIK